MGAHSSLIENRIRCRDSPSLAARGHFVQLEAEGPNVAEPPDWAAAPGCSERLGAVLDHVLPVLAGNLRHGIHVAGDAQQVHWHDRLGARRDPATRIGSV